MTAGGRRLSETYLELRDDGSVAPIALTPEFWPELMSGQRALQGRLVMAFAMTEDMTHWEIHPAGDEVLLPLSGRMTLVLEGDAGATGDARDAGDGDDERFTLQPGEAAVVPRGRWHRLEVTEPGDLVFMTPGDGTEHKPL